MKVAWLTEAAGITGVVAAETCGKARSVTRRCATDAGYRVGFTSVKARRAPQYDAWAATDPGVCSFSLEYVQGALAEKADVR